MNYQHTYTKTNKMPPANTDGKVNLLVMVFADFCTQDKFVTHHVPGFPQLFTIYVLYLDSFPAPLKLVPRHCASAHFVTFVTFRNICPFINLVPRLRLNSKNLVPGWQKPRHSLPAPGQFSGPAGAGYLDPARMLRRLTQTELYRRAVSCNITHNNLIFCNIRHHESKILTSNSSLILVISTFLANEK
jgi:hypothetical protein